MESRNKKRSHDVVSFCEYKSNDFIGFFQIFLDDFSIQYDMFDDRRRICVRNEVDRRDGFRYDEVGYLTF